MLTYSKIYIQTPVLQFSLLNNANNRGKIAFDRFSGLLAVVGAHTLGSGNSYKIATKR